ncbi:MAG: hypothetical protein COV91_00135 [Candidatus Taylorbacteria bacterium CG11_big_fil_rev_8_21_14_0_20_46_11]|uniref:Type II toxin-antitoxin system PemK/MazF family toxin n=1 Tax=Candidatus Taylorbacteria bacterium CG11_big_fil_rev_8_21_14_0_20_46_11 TaxID=1975025 RepID=A0A2H0KD44_9BACT|nr:MAG: hypothetical protein COV91_00135 [Candidatus Taylorbacteria bacterium CG11_big_fil_rev_8_21_14_0_20_46_11]
MFWSIPLSTKQKKFDFYYNFSDPDGKKVSVILAQLRLVSVKRLRRKLYDMSTNDMVTIKMRLQEFLD